MLMHMHAEIKDLIVTVIFKLNSKYYLNKCHPRNEYFVNEHNQISNGV
jgi:hypothetical protein